MAWKRGRGTDNEILIGLSQDETRKQADNIYSVVLRLEDPIEQNYITAKYFFDSDITRLMNYVHSFMTDRSLDVTILIKAYLGSSVTHREIRESLCCNNNNVKHYRKIVYDFLDKVHYKSMSNIDKSLEDAKLIERSIDLY